MLKLFLFQVFVSNTGLEQKILNLELSTGIHDINSSICGYDDIEVVTTDLEVQ